MSEIKHTKKNTDTSKKQANTDTRKTHRNRQAQSETHRHCDKVTNHTKTHRDVQTFIQINTHVRERDKKHTQTYRARHIRHKDKHRHRQIHTQSHIETRKQTVRHTKRLENTH